MVDYVLEYRNTKLAVVEAKAWDEALTEGVAQSKNSAGKLAICYTFSSSGQGIYGMVRPRRRRNVPRASTALDRPCPAGNPRGLGGIDDGAPASGGGKRAVRITPQPRHPPRYAGHSGIYLSRYITTTKPDYYRLLQTVRDEDRWAEWCLYIIRGVAVTSRSAIGLVKAFRDLMLKTRHDLRERLPRLYSQDLLNNLFRYSYTKIEFIERELGVSRPTAAKYLEQLTLAGLVRKQKMGKTNFYISEQLFALLSNVTLSCKKSANWIIRFYQEIAVNRVLERLSGLAVASVLSLRTDC